MQPYRHGRALTSGDGRFVIADAQPRLWIHYRETREQWEVMTAGYEGVFVTDLRGDRRAVLGSFETGKVRDRQMSIGFDHKGLLTMGARSSTDALSLP